MKIKLLVASAAFLLSTMTATAVPAKPVKKTFRQADGTLIELTLRGDEHYSFYTAEDGTPYRLKANGELLKLTCEEVSARWTELRNKHLAADPRRANARMMSRGAGIPRQTIGKYRGLIILVQFSDVKFASTDPQATFNRFFNEEGYHEYGNAGSVRDYFLKQSYGQLEINFDVVGPYTTGGSLAAYGAATEDNHDANPTAMVMEAIDQAAKEVDFSNYDWDNDGEVDQIFLICAGYSQAEGADTDYIWPHEWSLGAQGIARNYNGKKLNTYGVSTELWGNGKTTNLEKEIDGIGTACHEFSHCLGLPDFYDTQYNGGFGMSYWSVMDSGSYLDGGHTPPGYSSYERMFAGWLEPTELKEMTTITGMKPLATTPEAYILYNEGNKNEFYLLENRQLIDFDAKLPGHGMLVLHVDYDKDCWITKNVNTVPEHQRMTIIPADGKLSSSNMQGDPFPGIKGNTALASYTTPAPTLYNANVDGGYLMNKDIDCITESEDGLISFVACRPPLDVPQPEEGKEVEGEAAFTVSWPAVQGAAGYQFELTEIGAAATNPTEALEREFTFDKFISKTAGFTDVSSKMADYGLSGWSGSKIYTTPNKMRIGTSKESGYVRTATWRVPNSSELTVVIGAGLVKEGTTVKGSVELAYGNEGESAQYDTQDFELTEDGMMVFNFSTRKNLFWINIKPESQMYLNYFAIYDGTWDASQLGIAGSRQLAATRGTTITVYDIDKNSIKLENLNTGNRFAYRVRSVGEAKNYSGWSEEKSFKFSASGMETISVPQEQETIYDLQGRSYGHDANALGKGLYIIGGKKKIVK